MKLLVEIGNSRVKWMLSGTDGIGGEPFSSRHDDPSWVRQLPDTPVDAVCYASVAAAGTEKPLVDWAGANGVAELRRIVTAARAAGVTNAYAEPSRLGVDRWLACVAAHWRAPGQSVLIVDAGTALTVDYVDADGRHGGGLISPGVSTMRDAIRADTQVRAAEREPLAELLGRSTDAAVGQGTLYAALGLIGRARASLNPERVFLTGGEASWLAPHLEGDWEIVPALVLEGLDLLSRA